MTTIKMDRKKQIGADRFAFLENTVLRMLFYGIVVLVIAVVCLIIGLMIGYAIVGDGNAWDVLNWQTWQHILDYLNAN